MLTIHLTPNDVAVLTDAGLGESVTASAALGPVEVLVLAAHVRDWGDADGLKLLDRLLAMFDMKPHRPVSAPVLPEPDSGSVCGHWPLRARGLCDHCYGICHRLVVEGCATWQSLEAQGRCLKIRRKRRAA